jgi:hypothetical protein
VRNLGQQCEWLKGQFSYYMTAIPVHLSDTYLVHEMQGMMTVTTLLQLSQYQVEYGLTKSHTVAVNAQATKASEQEIWTLVSSTLGNDLRMDSPLSGQLEQHEQHSCCLQMQHQPQTL